MHGQGTRGSSSMGCCAVPCICVVLATSIQVDVPLRGRPIWACLPACLLMPVWYPPPQWHELMEMALMARLLPRPETHIHWYMHTHSHVHTRTHALVRIYM